MPLALVLLIALGFVAPPAAAQSHHRRDRVVCVPIYDPGVGTYRICAPAQRRR